MRYIDLFAGIGGFSLALNRLGHECVYASEWDKYAATTYEKNFGHRPDERDIKTVPTTDIPDHDILTGGFPCQTFSVAGQRAGFADTRGTLFFDIARILKDKQPRYFILENVKGLLSHDSGRTFKTIIATLAELGYDLQWQVLNSKDFGVPQNRERVFIVGHLRGTPRPQVFPIREGQSKDNRQIGQHLSSCLDANYWKGPSSTGQAKQRQFIVEDFYADRLRVSEHAPTLRSDRNGLKVGTYRTHKDGYGFREVKSGLAPTIPARARNDGSGQPVLAVPLKFLERNQKNFQGEYSFTVDTVNTGGVMQGWHVRRLTPVECERLQGFPDNWTAGVSDTQRYKQLGNAVTVNVVYYVASALREV